MRTTNQTTKNILTTLACLACISGLFAQDLPYDSGSTGADGAFDVNLSTSFTHRAYFAATFDPERGQVVAGGGIYYFSFPTSISIAGRTDTWVWDGAADTWTQKTTTGGLSSRPRDGAMAYHGSTKLVVYYGGRLAAGSSVLASHYSWNGTVWTLVSNSAAPGALALHGMAFDGNTGVDEVIMFGGWTGAAYVNTTWAWDGTTWTNKNPPNKPSIRGYTHLVWDAARNEIMLFGGTSGSGGFNDTWVWKNGDWTQKNPATIPPARYGHAIGYDPVSQKVIMHGGWTTSATGEQVYGDTWSWNGTDWTQVMTTKALTSRAMHQMASDTTNNELILMGGYDYEFASRDDSWKWDSTLNGGNGDWVQIAGSRYMVDMSAKANGVWNYTTINVPAGFSVDFVGNSNHSPVTWLASGDVTIHGEISVDGRPGWLRNNVPAMRALGGPGGFGGGLGGTRVEVFNSVSGTPGLGPAGGAPGVTNAQVGGHGKYQGIYGNAYIIPLIGGSGGGGSAASGAIDGGNGGGSGGAILIASSRDITVNGKITANGGYLGKNVSFNGINAGHGSGGAIKLVADRINGSGALETKNGGNSTASNQGGYVRLESYLKPFNISGTVASAARSDSAPVTGITFNNPPTLAVTNVAGAGVAQPPSGSFNNPDVIFNQAGSITITVTATNIPDGTTVTCKVIHSSGTINLPTSGTVTLSGGTATFNTIVPAGFGTIQAFATYDVTP